MSPIAIYLIGFLFGVFFFSTLDVKFKKNFFEGSAIQLPQSTQDQRNQAFFISVLLYSFVWFITIPYRILIYIVNTGK